MKHFNLTAIALIAGLILAACGRTDEVAESMGRGYAGSIDASAPAPAQPPPAPQAMPTRLIRNAHGRLEVRDLDAAVKSLTELVHSVNGTVAQSEISSDVDLATATFLARIPAESLDSVINALGSLGKVRSIATSSTDVTREYFDVETRLAVKEASVRRLTQLMDRASRVEDIVAVERELARATAELESLKGQITYFDRNIAQSELRLHLTESGSGFGTATARGVKQAIRNAAATFGQSIGTLIYLVVFLLPWMLVVMILWLILRKIRRRKAAM